MTMFKSRVYQTCLGLILLLPMLSAHASMETKCYEPKVRADYTEYECRYGLYADIRKAYPKRINDLKSRIPEKYHAYLPTSVPTQSTRIHINEHEYLSVYVDHYHTEMRIILMENEEMKFRYFIENDRRYFFSRGATPGMILRVMH